MFEAGLYNDILPPQKCSEGCLCSSADCLTNYLPYRFSDEGDTNPDWNANQHGDLSRDNISDVLKNDAVLEFMATTIVDRVSEIVGVKVKPIASIARRYHKGDWLFVHKNVSMCEYTVAICAHKSEDVPWLMQVGQLDEESGRIIGEEYDLPVPLETEHTALIYKGAELDHGRRDPCPVDDYIVAFFHFMKDEYITCEHCGGSGVVLMTK